MTVIYRDPVTGEQFVISGGERVPLTTYQEQLRLMLARLRNRRRPLPPPAPLGLV